jgi:hypothetical protein
MNLTSADASEVSYAAEPARAGILNTNKWHASNRPFEDLSIMVGWGSGTYGQTTIPVGLTGVTAIAAGSSQSLALKSNGTVVEWGLIWNGSTYVPIRVRLAYK